LFPAQFAWGASSTYGCSKPLAEARDYLEQLTRQGLALREEQQGLLRYRLLPEGSACAV